MVRVLLSRGQGEYVAALVMISIMISMVVIAMEWQKAIQMSATKAIESIEKAKEMLMIIKVNGGIRIINEWNDVSTVVALIYKFDSKNAFDKALAELSRIHYRGQVHVFQQYNIIIEILPNDTKIRIAPSSSKFMSSSDDPVLGRIANYARTICVYTLFNNVFCNITLGNTAPQSRELSPTYVNIYNASTPILNSFVVLNYTRPIVISYAHPSLSQYPANPSLIPLVILKNFTKIPKFLVETTIYVNVTMNATCLNGACRWHPNNFTIRIGSSSSKAHYVCVFSLYRGTFYGCNAGDDVVTTTLEPLLAVVDGIPMYINPAYRNAYTLAEIALGAISNDNYTLALASVMSETFKGSIPIAVMYATYQWRLCKFYYAWKTWGLCSTGFLYTIYDVLGLRYGFQRYSLVYPNSPITFDLPLTVLNITIPKLYPPRKPAPPETSEVITIIKKYPGYAPFYRRVNLYDFGTGYGTVVLVDSCNGVFVYTTHSPYIAYLRTLIPRYTIITSNSVKRVFVPPLQTYNITDAYRVKGALQALLKNVKVNVTAIEKINGNTYEKSIEVVNTFDLKLNVPISTGDTYTLLTRIYGKSMHMPAVAIFQWSNS